MFTQSEAEDFAMLRTMGNHEYTREQIDAFLNALTKATEAHLIVWQHKEYKKYQGEFYYQTIVGDCKIRWSPARCTDMEELDVTIIREDDEKGHEYIVYTGSMADLTNAIWEQEKVLFQNKDEITHITKLTEFLHKLL